MSTPSQLNLNTIVAFIILGVLGWVGVTTLDNSKVSAVMVANQTSLGKDIDEIKKSIKDSPSRADYDALRVQIAGVLTDVANVKLDMAKLQMNMDAKRKADQAPAK